VLNKIYTRGLAIAKKDRASASVSASVTIKKLARLGGVVDRVNFSVHLLRSPSEIGCCVIPCGRNVGGLQKFGGFGGALAPPIGKGIVHYRLVTRPSPTSNTVPNLAAVDQTVWVNFKEISWKISAIVSGLSGSSEPALIDCLPVI